MYLQNILCVHDIFVQVFYIAQGTSKTFLVCSRHFCACSKHFRECSRFFKIFLRVQNILVCIQNIPCVFKHFRWCSTDFRSVLKIISFVFKYFPVCKISPDVSKPLFVCEKHFRECQSISVCAIKNICVCSRHFRLCSKLFRACSLCEEQIYRLHACGLIYQGRTCSGPPPPPSPPRWLSLENSPQMARGRNSAHF